MFNMRVLESLQGVISANVKRVCSFLVLFSLTCLVTAHDLYWVGGAGKWSDANHWASLNGGKGSAGAPGENDIAYFTNASGLKKGDLVLVEANVICRAIRFNVEDGLFRIAVANNVVIQTTSSNDYSRLNRFLASKRVYESGDNPQSPVTDLHPVPLTHTCTISVVTDNLCPGECNGTATVTANPPGSYSYFWIPSNQTTQTATGLCAGQGYIVQVIDNTNPNDVCQAGILMTNFLPFGSFFNNVNLLCNGICTGQSTINVIGGTPPYSYLWTPTAQVTQVATGLCAQTYTITVTDANSCTYTATTTITQPPAISPNPTQTNVLCNPNCDGTATVAPTGGVAPYTYLWTPTAQTTPTATGLCAGTYTVTITDANNCTVTQTFTITQPPLPLSVSITATGNPVPCFGNCTATLTANPLGGVAPYTYVWAPGGQLTQTITGVCAGTYTVTITDANACTRTATFTVTEPPALTISITTTGNPLDCFGDCDASATATPGGGTPPYSYSWNPTGQITATATGLCAGTYTVTVSDANSCTITQTITITQPPALTASITTTNNPVQCFGFCTATATANPAGGTPVYTYSWNTIPVQLTQTATGLCAGTYTVTVTDANGCTTTQAITITQPTQIQIGLTITNNPLLCNGQCIATATTNASGGTPGYTYVWNPGGATTSSVAGLCAGSYTVTITDAAGCTRSQTFTITQPTLLTTTQSSTTLDCFGDCDANLGVSAFGGTAPYTYSWAPGGQTTSSITGQCAGSYTVTVTDANGCTSSQVITLLQPPAINLVTATIDPNCSSGCDGSATVIAGGGTAPYNYVWLPGGQTTATITGLCAGTYTVTVTDANGCTLTSSVTINNPPPVSTNVTQVNVSCFGLCDGSATAFPSGGTAPYTYLWNPGGFTTAGITGLCAGNYNLTVTDANGCSVSQIVTITQPPILVATISATTTSCNICNGTATANPIGGTAPYTFLWNTVPPQTGQTATGLCPGSYTVTITDANGCTATAVAIVLQTVQIVITTSADTLDCFGDCDGIATAVPSGGQAPYSYLWTPAPFQTTQTATGLCAGTYTVNVTDANGCFGVDSVTFNEPPQLTSSATTTNNVCNGACIGTATVTAGGGTPGYTYSWNTVPVQITPIATGLCSGSYTVTVTDANGCTSTTVVTITEPPAIAINPTLTLANCNLCDGAIVLNESGGTPPYTFLWSPAISVSNTAINVCAGSYTVTITDANGCTTSFTIALGNLNGPTLTMSQTITTCFGDCDGTATVLAVGGTPPYTYSWNPTGQITPTATGLCAGVYNVTVTDAPGCISFGTITVLEPPPFSIVSTIVNSNCGTNCDGSISIVPSGGTPPYTYLWNPGALTTQNITGLCAGIYTLTITDANLCDSIFTFTVTAPPPVTVTINFTNVNCNGACDGTAIANPAGGVGNFTYLWMPGAVVTQNMANMCPGTYTVTVTDANGCTATATVTITEPLVLTLVLNTSTPALCSNTCDGTASLIAGGGTPVYTYSWNPGGYTTPSETALCAGTYTVTVTDANGCAATLAVVIGAPSAVLTGLQQFNASCNGSCNGAAQSTPSGGTGPYTYLWTPGGATTQVVNGLCSGSYTLVVTDANNCTGSSIFVITAPTVLQPNGTIVAQPTCATSCDAILTSNPVGGTAPYSYLWIPGNIVTQTATGLCGQTTYTLTVTDANGCTATQVIAVSDPPPILVTPSVGQANCNVCNGTINIVPSGGTPPYTYLWTPGNMTTQNVSGLCAGLYFVTITDVNGCSATFSYGVSNTTGPTLAMSQTPASCPNSCDGTATVVAVGNAPFAYLWTPTSSVTTTITGLCPGSYTVMVTDAGSCITLDSVMVLSPPAILDNPTVTNAQCMGICNGSITVAPTGGNGGPYTYQWLAPLSATTATVINLCVGNYSVIITDATGCADTFNYVISGNAFVNFNTAATNINCSSACTGTANVFNLTGGTIPYSFNWSDPFGQFTQTATGLCAGTFTVIVTDANGCTNSQSVIVTASPPITLTANVTQPSCGLCNGSVTVTPSGGTGTYTYLWNTGGTTNTENGICAGLYQVTVTDSLGCSQTFSIPISNPGAPNPNVAITNPLCFGLCTGIATAAPTGGTPPYTYNWLPGGQTTPSINNLCPGTYFIQVIDANGCITTDTVIITSPSQILANQFVTNTDCGSCNGIINTNASGGVGPYTYAWLPGGQTTPGISNLCAGIYTLTITDANGCTQTFTIPITTTNGPTVSISTTDPSCNGICSGTATATVAGGTPPYIYNWSSGGTTNTEINLCGGVYTLTVIDATPCTTIVIVTINQPPPILFNAAIANNPLCNADCNGDITVIPFGGTPPYTYFWAPLGQTTPFINNLCQGSYTVTVTDANSCTATQVITLTDPPVLLISNVVVTNSSCNTIADGAIDITVTGGVQPYSYLWTPGNITTQDLTNILSGTYIVVVTDTNGCTTSDTITVTAALTVIADAGNDTAACEGGSFILDGSGSTNAITYSWFEIPSMNNLGNTVTVNIPSPSPGTYTYMLVASNGLCSDTDTVVIIINPIPFANAGADQNVIILNSVVIGGSPTGPAGSTYVWSPVGSLNDSTLANPTATPTVTTTYTVIVTSPAGCTAIDSVTVFVFPQIIFPNGISPNGDGANDTWIIDNIGQFPNNWVEIYNRWGELLFRGDGYDNVNVYWDGTYKKKPVPVGTYYYIINLNDPLYPDVFTGPLTVYR